MAEQLTLSEIFAMPPGPERRAAMLSHPRGPNISPADYTPAEWAELEAASSDDVEFTPIADLYA